MLSKSTIKSELTLALKHIELNKAVYSLPLIRGAFFMLSTNANQSKLKKSNQKVLEYALSDFKNVLACLGSINIALRDKNAYARDTVATVLITAFHVEFRPVFDYVTEIVVRENWHRASTRILSNSERKELKKNLTRPNFANLRRWCKSHNAKAKLIFGQDTVKVIESCSWFRNINSVRNDIVHNGASVQGWVEDNEAYFEVHSLDGRKKILRESFIPKRMFKARSKPPAVAFSCYSGMYVGRLLLFLNRLMEALAHHRGLILTQGGWGDFATDTAKDWVERAKGLV